MVFNATFNNSSAILWLSLLLVEYPVKATEMPQVTNIMFLCMLHALIMVSTSIPM